MANLNDQMKLNGDSKHFYDEKAVLSSEELRWVSVGEKNPSY